MLALVVKCGFGMVFVEVCVDEFNFHEFAALGAGWDYVEFLDVKLLVGDELVGQFGLVVLGGDL